MLLRPGAAGNPGKNEKENVARARVCVCVSGCLSLHLDLKLQDRDLVADGRGTNYHRIHTRWEFVFGLQTHLQTFQLNYHAHYP